MGRYVKSYEKGAGCRKLSRSKDGEGPRQPVVLIQQVAAREVLSVPSKALSGVLVVQAERCECRGKDRSWVMQVEMQRG